MEDGNDFAIPNAQEGIVYKRPVNCSPVELAAQLTVEEAAIITAAWNENL